ncbi:unnamed protein product [Cylindrotheca closterium]|uniref:Purinergic receptor n=1 Tax=Cylindrotheca closterium TaxID=2856 RepID=A0AAD2G2H6_9STRA|nr:unnamed protein product [Cylindrotheca closterium]
MSSFPLSFSYETVKYVKVEDSRLGCLRLILLLGILLYVGVIEMAYMGGYLEATRVVGAVRFSLQHPEHGSDCPSTTTFVKEIGTEENCTNDFAPLDTLAYCEQSRGKAHRMSVMNDEQSIDIRELEDESSIIDSISSTSDYYYKGSVFPCQIYEAINAQVMRESSMVVWTRATTKNQTLVCGSGDENTCRQTYETTEKDSDSNRKPFYIAQSEAFTLLIEHAATASHICETKFQKQQSFQSRSDSSTSLLHSHYSCSAQAEDFPRSGRLLSLHHGLCQEAHTNGQRAYVHPLGDERISRAPCYILPNRTSNHHDFFTLDVLLKSAGISSLDDCVIETKTSTNTTTIDNSTTYCTTFRESGATILLTVLWNDFLPYQGILEPYYHYKARIIGTNYKETQAFYSSYRNSRVLFSAHGIKVAVVVGGNFHQFTWLNFIITITTALGMLAVATAVVDTFMLYVLPEKEQYQECKYERVQRPMLEGIQEDEDGEQGQSEEGVQGDLLQPLLETG